MNLFQEYARTMTRRHFFAAGAHAVGWAALASLLGTERAHGASAGTPAVKTHFPAKAKQVIYLHMVGGPPQMDLYDYKPQMNEWYDKDLPDSIRRGQRLTTMTSGQARFPIAPSKYKFARHGKSGMWVSELLSWTAKMVDDMCFIRSMHTEAINHEPAITMMQTGNQVTGRPCLGAWASYGLGSLNQNLPTFVVLVARPTNTEQVQAISARLWSSGYLSGEHAGVSFRSSGDPILYINNPPGVPAQVRRETLDGLKALNEMNYRAIGDPETHTRIQQYEMAFHMQASVPDLTDTAKEPESTFRLYGDEAKKPGTFANSALLARRLVEGGVRFITINNGGWDHHAKIWDGLGHRLPEFDRGFSALLEDMQDRGLLSETLVLVFGEFGRSPKINKDVGRDHWGHAASLLFAGAGVRGGQVIGQTDKQGGEVTRRPVAPADVACTVYEALGIDPRKSLVTPDGRPVEILDKGENVKELYA